MHRKAPLAALHCCWRSVGANVLSQGREEGRRGSKCAIKWRWLSGERRGSYCEQDCRYVTRDDCDVFLSRGPFVFGLVFS